jgi:hypothetical protein
MDGRDLIFGKLFGAEHGGTLEPVGGLGEYEKAAALSGDGFAETQQTNPNEINI